MEPLHVVQVLEAGAGGTRRHLRDLVHALDRRHFRLTLIVSLGRDPDFMSDIARFRQDGVAVEVVPMKRRIAPLADAVAVVRLTRLLRRLRPDLVHAHSSKAGMLARAAARMAGGVPTVYTPHAFSFLSDSPMRGLFLLCERLAARGTGRLIAVSREEREWACDGTRGLAMSAERVWLVPNGIEADGLPSATVRRPPVVGFVGRMCRQKGPDFFLEVVRRIHASRPDVQFRMVGDGPWRAWVEKRLAQIGSDVQVMLRTARDEVAVAEHMAEIDVLVMPSRWEGLPYTLLEAMAAGVPVAAMAAGGIGDVVADGQSGLLCPVGDVDGLAARALALISDQTLAERLRVGARKRLEAYTLRAMVDALSAVYEELALRENAQPQYVCR